MPENAVLPQTLPIRYAPKTQDTWLVVPEMVAIKDPLKVYLSYLTSFGFHLR